MKIDDIYQNGDYKMLVFKVDYRHTGEVLNQILNNGNVTDIYDDILIDPLFETTVDRPGEAVRTIRLIVKSDKSQSLMRKFIGEEFVVEAYRLTL